MYLFPLCNKKQTLNLIFPLQGVKSIKADLDNNLHMSPRQYAAGLLNPNRMLTATFWRILSEMFKVRKKRNLRV